MRWAAGKPEATLLTTWMPDTSISTVKLQDARRQSNVTKLIEMFEKQQQKEQFLKHESKARDQQVQGGITKITRRHEPNRDLRTLREFCKNFNVLVAVPLTKSVLFIAVAGEIWSTSGVLQPKALIATLLQSLALSLRRIPVEDPSTAHLKDRSCSSRRRRCLRKQDSQSTGANRRLSKDGMHKKDTEIRWESTILAKRKLCFSIATLLKDTTTQLHELNGYRTPNIGSFVYMLMGPKCLFDSDQNLSTHQNNAWKCKIARLAKNATNSDTDTSTTSTASTTKSTIRRRRKLRSLCRSENWMAAQCFHLQLRSGHFHNGERVGAHGSLHHLRNGGDFGFVERIPENRRSVQTGHPLAMHICAVQFVHKRGTHITHLAQKGQQGWNESVIWCCTCLTRCCSLTCRLPRAHHLRHSLSLLWHKNKRYNRWFCTLVGAYNGECYAGRTRVESANLFQAIQTAVCSFTTTAEKEKTYVDVFKNLHAMS